MSLFSSARILSVSCRDWPSWSSPQSTAEPEAKTIGLVNKIFSPEELRVAVDEVAKLIATKGRASLCRRAQVLSSINANRFLKTT